MIIKLMLDLGTFNYPNNYYLFGPKFMPSEEWMYEQKGTPEQYLCSRNVNYIMVV